MTPSQKAEALLHADDRPQSLNDDLYAWAVAAEKLLRTLAAEAQGEPVVWIQPDHLQKARIAPFSCRVEPTKRMLDFVPLYTHPATRKPLTDARIYELMPDKSGMEWTTPVWTVADLNKFARAIEQAQPEPLTDEQIWGLYQVPGTGPVDFARAVLAAQKEKT